jgi:S-adenosylmethionine:tRNA ribosyltransferase-isomerase
MHPKYLRIEDFTYLLPEDRIAKFPLEERDASRLLIYKHGEIAEDIYRNIANHLSKDALMVFNQTKVVHARLLFRKPTGGLIEVFCLAPHEQYADVQIAMQQRGHVLWECLVGGAAKWKEGVALALENEQPHFTLRATIALRNDASFVLRLSWNNESLTFADVLHHAGKVPLPPYLNRKADASDEERYQTIFAKEDGSVAAPTAGLNFTPQVLQSIAAKEIDTAFVTLHVGAGTFKPVKSDAMAGHSMHAEWMEVSYATVQRLMQQDGRKIVAVGTTSLRTLESLYWIGSKLISTSEIDLHGIAVSQWDPYELPGTSTTYEALAAVAEYMNVHKLSKLITRTQILIAPGYSFRVVNGLVTNFHQPQSTLLLLVAAFIGDNWRAVYNHALQHGYRFLSYGDGSLLFR